MYFQATSVNVIELLLGAFALCVLYFLSKQKLDSNLPLLFYTGLMIFTNATARHVDPILFGAGLIFALLLRFEFLNSGVTKLVLLMEMLVIVGIVMRFVTEVFG